MTQNLAFSCFLLLVFPTRAVTLYTYLFPKLTILDRFIMPQGLRATNLRQEITVSTIITSMSSRPSVKSSVLHLNIVHLYPLNKGLAQHFRPIKSCGLKGSINLSKAVSHPMCGFLTRNNVLKF